jgi:PhzF family phenazine biosynthesis protein
MNDGNTPGTDEPGIVATVSPPAGYIWLDADNDISELEMLQIARELKGFLNEVGFIFRSGERRFDLKYYSAEREVDFCGHATIAIMYDLIKNDKDLIKYDVVKIRTNKGELEVENRIRDEDSVFIMSPLPEEKTGIPTFDTISFNLKISAKDLDLSWPVRIINAGLNTLIVPIRTLECILNISADFNRLKEFCFTAEVDIIEVFTNEVADKTNDYRTRVFAPTFGYMEDPATGSGNSAFGYYLLNLNKWKKETVVIEQNGLINNYNIIKLRKKRDENNHERVLFGGGAITRISGEYTIY